MAENDVHPFRHRLEEYLALLSWHQWLIVIAVVILGMWLPEPPLWERAVNNPSNVVQIAVNSIFTGSTYVLLAIGLTLVYRILRFANFAHAEFVTFGAYMAFLALIVADSIGLDVGRDIFWGIVIAFILTGLLGVVSDKVVFGQLRERNANAMTIMISSIGVGLIIRHLIQEVWTGASVWYTPNLPEWIPEILLPTEAGWHDYLLFKINVRLIGEIIAYDIHFLLLKITLTPIKLFVIICSTLLVLACHLIFTRTKLGKAMRATSDNPDLAQAAGIDINRVILLVWFLGAGLAGVGGVLSIVSVGRVEPDTGFKLLIVAFAVVILGGIGSFYGAILAAYIIGFAENFGILAFNGCGKKYEMLSDFFADLQIGSLSFPFRFAEMMPLSFSFGYKPAISFAILVIVLILRPRGIMGLPEEVGKEE